MSTQESDLSFYLGTSSSDEDENHQRLTRRMDDATHKHSFQMHGIEHYECFKATSLWLNDILPDVEIVADSDNDRGTTTSAAPTADYNVSIVSLNAADSDD